MLSTWKQINEKFNIILNSGIDGKLSELEIKIYNGDFNQNDLDLTNIDTLIALSNYYMLIKNDQHRLIILNKLAEMGDNRGHANLGCYYYNINRAIAVNHFEKASELGNLNAKFNLAKHYIEFGDLDKSTILCEELEKLNYIPVYMLLAQIYGFKGDIQKMMDYLKKGIEVEDKNCLTSLEMIITDLIKLKQFLLQLKENNLINNKIIQLNSIIEENSFNCEK